MRKTTTTETIEMDDRARKKLDHENGRKMLEHENGKQNTKIG